MLKPSPKEIRRYADNLRDAGTDYKDVLAQMPLHIVDALMVQAAVDEGAQIAITENALLIRWPGTMKMIRLFYTEEINNYLVDLAYPALI